MERLSVLYFLFLYGMSVAPVYAQHLRVLSESAVSPPEKGSHDWYDIEADPDNARNLIACGARWEAVDNAYYGFVYASQDGGAKWHTALEDKNSKWVSEESCAFGVHGVAYFIADASNIDSGGVLHHELGTTRIWVSHDSGRSWALGTTAGWTDFSASVVDRNPGPDQNRLYIFFNNLWTYYTSIDDKQALDRIPKWSRDKNGKESVGNSIGLISYKEGDGKVAGPVFDPEMYKLELRGSYPSQNLLLSDGSLLALFWSKKANFDANGRRNGRQFILASQHTDPLRRSVSKPVILYQWPEMTGQPKMKCNSYLTTPAGYDPNTNTVYAIYLDGANDKCTLMLTKSTDDGQTWSSSAWTEEQTSNNEETNLPAHDYSGIALTRSNDGTLALLWRDSDRPDCWLFSISADDGHAYTHPQQISTGSKDSHQHGVDIQSLDLYIAQADEKKPEDDVELRIDNHSGDGRHHTSGIAITPDGIFHPLWVANGGQLYTAAIAVIKTRDRSKPEPPRVDGWQYETNRVKFTYGGSQSYDDHDRVLTESIVIRNSGTGPLKGPIRLEITPESRAGILYPLDVLMEGAGDTVAQYLDVSQYIPGDGLAAGASSFPIPLRFHFEPYSDAKQDGSVANISIRLLTKVAK
jgi:hypothetical protein